MSLLFVSVVREGLSSTLAIPDTGVSSAELTDRQLADLLKFNASAILGGSSAATVPIQTFGPAQVDGMDPTRLVLRTDPPPSAQGFDTSLFPLIEFDVPGLPWMFTPLAANNNRLRPWLALVVLPVGADGPSPLDIEPLKHGRLAVLTVNQLADLPPIDDTWAWAHAQFAVVGATATAADLTALVRDHHEATLSRLLCPRRLSVRQHYVACVVPTFEAGRTAGLKQTPDQTANPAWGPKAIFPLQLPVYYSWEFFTGDAANFEQSVRQLRSIAPPAKAGRVLDASDPGRDVVRDAGASALPLAGALRPDTLQVPSYTGPAVAGYERLARVGETVTSPAGQTYPVVNVPLYAGKQVGATSAASAPGWVHELNTDPRHRVAAALGAKIVQNNQEALMGSAWDQAGDLAEVNRRLRRARLGRAASAGIVKRHITPLADVQQLAVFASVASRLALAGVNRTLAGLAADSRLPALVLSPNYTALTRPGGRIARRLSTDAARGVVTGIDAGTIEPDRGIAVRPGEMVTLKNVTDVVRGGRPAARRGPVARTPGVTPVPAAAVVQEIKVADAGSVGGSKGSSLTLKGPFTIPGGATIARISPATLSPQSLAEMPGRVMVATGRATIDVTDANKKALAAMFTPALQDSAAQPPALGVAQVAAQALTAIDPEKCIAKGVRARMTIPANLASADQLEDVLAAPRFDAPLSVDLIRIAPDLLLPGLDEIALDRVFAVVSNPAFVQALLAGANYEMMRELRWRGFPTDERGTSFHRFWRADADEIPDLSTVRAGALGSAVTGGADVVVVVRSSLLARFPGTQIFSVPGDASSGTLKPNFDNPVLPIFKGQLSSDVAFFGFGFTAQAATGTPGQYLVFQQPAGAPSFGLDLVGAGGFPANASDLGWNDVTMTGSFVKAEKLGPAFADNGATWGDSAADQAVSTLQQPVRAAIHFRQLLGTP